MIKPDVPIVMVYPGFNGALGLSNVDLPKLERDAENARCFLAKVTYGRPKETVHLFKVENYRVDNIQ